MFSNANQVYFFIIVLLHYVELGQLTEWPAVKREQPEGQDLPDLGFEHQKNNCLIDLELEEKHDSSRSSNQDLSFAKDDTFTQLAVMRQANGRAIGDGGAVAFDKVLSNMPNFLVFLLNFPPLFFSVGSAQTHFHCLPGIEL